MYFQRLFYLGMVLTFMVGYIGAMDLPGRTPSSSSTSPSTSPSASTPSPSVSRRISPPLTSSSFDLLASVREDIRLNATPEMLGTLNQFIKKMQTQQQYFHRSNEAYWVDEFLRPFKDEDEYRQRIVKLFGPSEGIVHEVNDYRGPDGKNLDHNQAQSVAHGYVLHLFEVILLRLVDDVLHKKANKDRIKQIDTFLKEMSTIQFPITNDWLPLYAAVRSQVTETKESDLEGLFIKKTEKDLVLSNEMKLHIDQIEGDIQEKMANDPDIKTKHLRILTIDGGGTRGIVPAVMIGYIEKSVNERLAPYVKEWFIQQSTHPQIHQLHITDIFKAFAGTSTGGILSIACNLKLDDGSPAYWGYDGVTHGRKTMETIYRELASVIFGPEQRVWFGGFFRDQYSPQGLQQVLKKLIPEHHWRSNDPWTSLRRFVGIVTFNKVTSDVEFVSKRTQLYYKVHYTLEDLVRMTSAAPTFLPEHYAKGEAFVDGGVAANNPTFLAMTDMFKYFPKARANPQNVVLVSLGTGFTRVPMPGGATAATDAIASLANGLFLAGYTIAENNFALLRMVGMHHLHRHDFDFTKEQKGLGFTDVLANSDPKFLDFLAARTRLEESTNFASWESTINDILNSMIAEYEEATLASTPRAAAKHLYTTHEGGTPPISREMPALQSSQSPSGAELAPEAQAELPIFETIDDQVKNSIMLKAFMKSAGERIKANPKEMDHLAGDLRERLAKKGQSASPEEARAYLKRRVHS